MQAGLVLVTEASWRCRSVLAEERGGGAWSTLPADLGCRASDRPVWCTARPQVKACSRATRSLAWLYDAPGLAEFSEDAVAKRSTRHAPGYAPVIGDDDVGNSSMRVGGRTRAGRRLHLRASWAAQEACGIAASRHPVCRRHYRA